MRFKDKIAIITGGASGMGKAAALRFANEGAFVVINDMDEALLEETKKEILSINSEVLTVSGDITKHETINSITGRTLERFGRIDILFNYVGGTPGMAPMSLFTDQTEDYWDKIIDINLKSTVLLSRAVIDNMMENRYGKIINTGAVAGRIGGSRMALYSAVKGGIIAFTKALALELAPFNINVNCVSPGPILTPGLRKTFPGVDLDDPPDIVPLARFGYPEEVASAVLYLASDEASFITGQTLAVDGGSTMI